MIILLLLPLLSLGQQNTINQVVTESLEIISGDKGAPRNWDAFRKLFTPTATMVAVYSKGDTSMASHMTLEQYIEGTDKFVEKNAFTEDVLNTRVDSFQGLAYVWQEYEVILEEKKIKGVNMYLLVQHEGNWLISHITWQNLKKGGILPSELKPYNPFTWLEGEWTRDTKSGSAFEKWWVTEDGGWEGYGGTIKDGKQEKFEHLWIKNLGGTFVYIAQPGKAQPVLFTYAGTYNDLITFSNTEHDFPQHIVYQKHQDGTMTATIKGPGKEGEEQQYKFHFTPKL